jgi:hypothetical protein
MDLSGTRIRRAVRDTWTELKARRAGRAGIVKPKVNSARQIAGITGALMSNGYDRIAEGSKAYEKSFDPHIPPSVHVSYNDMLRHNVPVPLAERCIEDWQSPPRPDVDAELNAILDEAGDC